MIAVLFIISLIVSTTSARNHTPKLLRGRSISLSSRSLDDMVRSFVEKAGKIQAANEIKQSLTASGTFLKDLLERSASRLEKRGFRNEVATGEGKKLI